MRCLVAPALVHDDGMKISDLRDASDTAGDLAAASRRYVSDVSFPDVSLPDVSLPDALDIDITDIAGNAIEFAGDMAGIVASRGGRWSVRAAHAAWRNPKVTLGAVAILAMLIGALAAKRRSSDPSIESIS